jgi:hypothetical protein
LDAAAVLASRDCNMMDCLPFDAEYDEPEEDLAAVQTVWLWSEPLSRKKYHSNE